MKRNLLLLIYSLVMNLSLPAQDNSSVATRMNVLPDDFLSTEVILVLGFGTGESTAEQSKVKAQITSSLKQYGVHIVYAYIQKDMHDIKDAQAQIKKYNPRYALYYSTTLLYGMKLTLVKVPEPGETASYYDFPQHQKVEALMADVKRDIDAAHLTPTGLIVENDSSGVDEVTEENIDDTTDSSEGEDLSDMLKLYTMPEDLKTETLMVVLMDEDIPGAPDQLLKHIKSENDYIRKYLESYPYQYQIITYTEYVTGNMSHKYVLIQSNDSEKVTYIDTKNGRMPNTVNRYHNPNQQMNIYGSTYYTTTKIKITYNLFIIEPAHPDHAYVSKKWKSTSPVWVYHTFAKSFQ